MKETILSGIRPSGVPGPYGSLHLGNLFGALLQFVELKNNPDNQCLFFVADYHALTDLPAQGVLGKLTEHVLLMYLALGLNTNNSIIYVQSHVPEIMELDVILRNLTSLGKLLSLPTFKEKLGKILKKNGHGEESASQEEVAEALFSNMGLVNYPILMAADILGPSSTVVPVGEDQQAHIELTRDIARAFNYRYGQDDQVWIIPDIRISNAPRIPGLDGSGKMGKTDDNSILILDPPNVITEKLQRAVTDPNRATVNDAGNPENCKSIFPFHELTQLTPDFQEVMKIREGCKTPISQGGRRCVDCKQMLHEKLARLLGPIQAKYWELAAQPDFVRQVATRGARAAREIISPRLKEAKEAIGLYPE